MSAAEMEGQGISDGDVGPKKKERGFDAVALRELRRARKLVKDGEPTPEATFAVATANVLALRPRVGDSRPSRRELRVSGVLGRQFREQGIPATD